MSKITHTRRLALAAVSAALAGGVVSPPASANAALGPQRALATRTATDTPPDPVAGGTQGAAAQPNAAQPHATQPDATQPDATRPDATQPNATQPDAAQPNVSQQSPAQPESPAAHPSRWVAAQMARVRMAREGDEAEERRAMGNDGDVRKAMSEDADDSDDTRPAQPAQAQPPAKPVQAQPAAAQPEQAQPPAARPMRGQASAPATGGQNSVPRTANAQKPLSERAARKHIESPTIQGRHRSASPQSNARRDVQPVQGRRHSGPQPVAPNRAGSAEPSNVERAWRDLLNEDRPGHKDTAWREV
jgi:hypothetical protein